MARQRTFLTDYNRMGKSFPYVVVRENGSVKHGNIYAHNREDAISRLASWQGVRTIQLLEHSGN